MGRAPTASELPDTIVVVDAQAAVCWANPSAEELIGRSLQACLGMTAFDLVHPDDIGLAIASMRSVQTKRVGTPIEVRLATADGWTLVEVVGKPLADGRTVLSLRDLTARRRWEVAANDTARFRSLVNYAAGLTLLLQPDGVVQSVSGAMTRQLGHDPERVCGHPLYRLVDRGDRDALRAAIADAIASGTEPVTVELGLVDDNGRVVPFELSIVSLLDDPTVDGLVVSGHDISRLRAARASLEHQAATDPLTGLANRRMFDACLEREWTLTSRDGIDSYVVIADLDDFKQVNDDHGHAAGDDALRQFSGLLRSLARDTDTVARLGGDEFAVILVRCGGEAAAIGLEARLQEELASADGCVGWKLGVTTGHQSLRRAASATEALHSADVAMLACKSSRRRRQHALQAR